MIVDHTTLKSAIADWLLRTDLTDVIPTFIRNAEAKLRRDPRVRRLVVQDLAVSSRTTNLPSTFKALDSVAHAGSTYFGDLEVTTVGALDEYRGATVGVAGPPKKCAVVPGTGAGGTLYVAPSPDGTYTLRLSYWGTIPHLGGGVLTNWLLEGHPDLYLYACLVESAPYLREDERVALWQTERETKLEELHMAVQDTVYSGPMARRPRNRMP